ncbi:VWA domain-containing protein [Desulfospira joergensenii]|uniref:VWA domain-containing protein n=1 Tax=Desulfospira joergensenii TaxID=53329 RepID=UPI0003F68639|nr:VWA domain-containing protein [Desulfospira joergensenii]
MESIDIHCDSLGKQTKGLMAAKSGRYVKSAPVKAQERGFHLAFDATLRAALIRNAQDGITGNTPIESPDLRKKVFKRPGRTLIVFLVDSSDSMGEGTFVRMRAAKGAALALIAKAGKKRHRVGMVAFREKSAQVILRPTSSLALARERLKALPTGGATPFADGLMKAWQMVKNERLKDPGIQPLLVVISDGEANVPHDSSRGLLEVMDELFLIAGRIGRDKIHSIVVDTKPPMEKSRDMLLLSEALGGAYHHISRSHAKSVVEAVKMGPGHNHRT